MIRGRLEPRLKLFPLRRCSSADPSNENGPHVHALAFADPFWWAVERAWEETMADDHEQRR
eukprot:9477076-Alexandrium_andersonii.AAC.1